MLIQKYINTELKPVCEQSAIETIRWYFRHNTQWDWVIVDAKFTDGDILEYLSDANFDIPVAIGTIKYQVSKMEW